jgi:hypothetical protein
MKRFGWFALLFPVLAHAQVVTVEVQHTPHLHGLTKQEARAVYNAAARQIHDELGVRLRLVRWSTKRGTPYRASSHADAYYEGLEVDPSPGADIVLKIRPKYRWSGKLWSAGIAYKCGWGTTVMTGRFARFVGHETDHARVAITHELAHVLGAGHSDGIDMMHEGAQGLLEAAGWFLGFTEQSRREVEKCQEVR